MSKKTNVLMDQIKEICKMTAANWATILVDTDAGWLYSSAYRLTKARKKGLKEFLEAGVVTRWLEKSRGSNRVRTRKLGKYSKALGCERVFLFSGVDKKHALLVGVDSLDEKEKSFFNILAATSVGKDIIELDALNEIIQDSRLKKRSDVSFNPSETLQEILATVKSYLPAKGAYLTVRSGDMFRLEAEINIAEAHLEDHILISENEALAKMVKTRQGIILEAGEGKHLRIGNEKKTTAVCWLGVPLIIGKRVIGYMAFEDKNIFSPADLDRATTLSHHVAPAIEKTMAYIETSRHLQKFALLNELASVASAGLDKDKIIRRVFRMLERTFQAGKVELLLISSDNGELYDATRKDKSGRFQTYSIESTLVGNVVETGKLIRTGNVGKAPRYLQVNPNVRSKLAVPLRFHGNVIGVLALESNEQEAFTKQDENFLQVIASQVAGLIENAQLIDETRQRVFNLMIVNELVQKVVGETDMSNIANLSVEMIADRFEYDMVMVLLLDKSKEELVAEGTGGKNPPALPEKMRFAKQLGIAGQVLVEGESRLIEETGLEEEYFYLPDWEPGSGFCVPLREAEDVFGVIIFENQETFSFSENDRLTLEALAGVISSVMMYSRRYHQLQLNIRQLEAVRETALDLSTDLDLNLLLRRVVNRVRELVDARGAEVGLVDENKSSVKVLVSENPWQDYTGYTFPLMAGVAGRVAALGEPIVVGDYNTWSGKGEDEYKAPFTTVAGVPLILRGETIGTLTVQDDRPNRSFGPQDVQTLELLSPQVTVFIRNARLYQELEERIGAQRLAEERMIRSAKLAAVGEMAAGVAHELNNPLTTVTGFAELILEEVPEDFPHRQDLEMVLDEALRARSVVRRLLDFSRQGDILRAQVDINEVMSDVLALVHHQAHISGVEVVIGLWDDMPQIRIDRNQMQQVFLNLMHNSIQAMPEGGAMKVQTTVEERDGKQWIMVKISDSGEGIDQEDLPRIFEPFFTTKPSGAGTGLGLSVSYGIVSDHGGYIDVESELGEGSSFMVWLPIEIESESVNA
ncbi:MAG: GAF domain-containing protein [Chloroflexi bacterium]|nr:GAF domain-containing protein [Chloroflexota bacterium]